MSEVLSMRRPWDLARAWQRLRAEEPGVRAREAAQKLCTSEAELVASGCGTSAVRLDPNFGALIAGLSGLGEVMALTRDDEDLIVQVFGRRKPGQPECARWRQIVEGLCGEPPAA